MPITEALKKLIKTITGKNAVGETIEELVQNLNDNYPEGGGGDEYETVAEIAVGTMEEEDGLFIAHVNTPFTDNLTDGDSLFFNSIEYPLEIIRDDEEGFLQALWYNWSGDEGPTGNPSFMLEYDSDGGVFEVLVSTENISNTTVKILKKVSGGGSITVDDELSDTSKNPVQNKVISEALTHLAENKANKGDLPLVVRGTKSGTNVTIETEIKDIYNAAEDGRVVLLDTNIGQQRIRFNLYGYAYDETNDKYSCGFSMLSPDPDAAAVMRVTFEQSNKTGTLTTHGIAYV